MKRNVESLREQVLEIAGIAESCPERFQERCFELLLEDLLRSEEPVSGVVDDRRPTVSEPDRETHDSSSSTMPQEPAPVVDNSSDIQDTDLHVKAKSFLKKQGLSVSDLNEILYREEGVILPLYDDLKSTKLSESQIRVALLSALRVGLDTGEFVFDGEDVRVECQTRKCYDANNYTANFKNSASLFDGFERYDRSKPKIRLSEEGKKQLGDLVRELA